METITLTFGDCGENHVGMEKIGTPCSQGFSLETLREAQVRFHEAGFQAQLHELSQGLPHEAGILIIRRGIESMIVGEIDDLFAEQKALLWDTKAFMYGRVVNKHARHNLCFSKVSQEPDYAAKKGRIIAWDTVNYTHEMKNNLELLFGVPLIGEGNRYYDINKCGIGFHGDTERRIVIGCRLGASMNLLYQWYYKDAPVGENDGVYLESRGHVCDERESGWI